MGLTNKDWEEANNRFFRTTGGSVGHPYRIDDAPGGGFHVIDTRNGMPVGWKRNKSDAEKLKQELIYDPLSGF